MGLRKNETCWALFRPCETERACRDERRVDEQTTSIVAVSLGRGRISRGRPGQRLERICKTTPRSETREREARLFGPERRDLKKDGPWKRETVCPFAVSRSAASPPCSRDPSIAPAAARQTPPLRSASAKEKGLWRDQKDSTRSRLGDEDSMEIKTKIKMKMKT